MRPRIAPTKIANVQRLLRSGKSQRIVADRCGVSLPIVNEIAQGKRDNEIVQFSEQGIHDGYQSVKPYRCPGCNRTVTTAPCVACSSKRG